MRAATANGSGRGRRPVRRPWGPAVEGSGANARRGQRWRRPRCRRPAPGAQQRIDRFVAAIRWCEPRDFAPEPPSEGKILEHIGHFALHGLRLLGVVGGLVPQLNGCPCPAAWRLSRCRPRPARSSGRSARGRCRPCRHPWHCPGRCASTTGPTWAARQCVRGTLPTRRTRKHHQTAMRVLGDGELAGARRAQDVTVPGRHGKPSLRIQTERRSPLKHAMDPLFVLASDGKSKWHFSPLICTFALYQEKPCLQSGLFNKFFNEIKDLDAFCMCKCKNRCKTDLERQ